jgi:hypothetical protein
MLRLPFVLVFVALAFLSWGVYGPVLHLGQEAMGHSKWRPFMCVGMAYFLVAVIVPLALMGTRRESGKWSLGGIGWSLLAGAAGAIGALGIIFAFKFGGTPVYVMPIVFGIAPVVNTLVTMWMTKSAAEIGLLFLTGVLLVAVGAAGVFVFKPKPVETQTVASDTKSETQTEQSASLIDLMKMILAVAVTVLCWGCYGPTLHKGQTKMEGSRLRPFLCVGVAYFLIAVIVPMVVLVTFGEQSGDWTLRGISWSVAAGVAGAVGALGIIMAFDFGGKPVFVMPLVFGGAPVVNTLTSLWGAREISLMFFVSLVCVIAGAVCVLIFAPKGGPKPKLSTAEPEPAPATS